MRRNFLESTEGRQLIWRRHEMRTVRLHIQGIEPSSKKGMSAEDKAKFQQFVADELSNMNRRAFRGPIAIDIWAGTTGRTPSHVQNIAKNLLDLLAKPVHIRHAEGALLFRDDSQVHGLSIRCDHGNAEPFFWITATPFRNVLRSLEIIGTQRHSHEQHEHFDHLEWEESLARLRDLKESRNMYGSVLTDQLERWYRSEAQANWLKGSSITPSVLGHFYPNPKWKMEPYMTLLRSATRSFTAALHINPNRILLPELPQRDGGSRDYGQYVRKSYEEFHSRFGKHLLPLETPLAIEVLVKPPPIERQRGLHDLDNVCRDYLIPRLVELFKPPLFNNISRPSPGLGLMRYEVWRVSREPDDGSPGFVSVSLVSDLYPSESLFTRIHRDAEKIIEEQD